MLSDVSCSPRRPDVEDSDGHELALDEQETEDASHDGASEYHEVKEGNEDIAT